MAHYIASLSENEKLSDVQHLETFSFTQTFLIRLK